MSRVAKLPIEIIPELDLKIDGQELSLKGSKGSLKYQVHKKVIVRREDNVLIIEPADKSTIANAMSGTMRAIINNCVKGVTKGFERKLILVGVGYRAQLQGKKLNLQLGLSHPVHFDIPEGITIETPTQTEIFIKGIDKQSVGQVAAKIRNYRPPEPYKGKGIRYSDEKIVLKETKKK